MAAETIPAEPMPAEMRALVARNAWQECGTSKSAQDWYATREATLDALDAPAAAAIASGAYWAEHDDPEPTPEGWAR